MVDFELSGALAVVRLDRPEKMDALSPGMLDALGEAFLRVAREPGVHACVLTGVGEGAFSVGKGGAELSSLDEDAAREAARRCEEVCARIEHCPVPVIAAVDGVVAGGGCELALACHLRIASTRAQFIMPETEPGLMPAYGGTQRLARIIGRERALALTAAGESVSAEEAHRTGLVSRLTSPEQLSTEAESLARTIGGLAPLAVRACLEAVTRGTLLPLEEGLALEAELFSRLFATQDMREGTRAFLEKRAPVFKGE
jgi:enoyl-CoA hydratase